MFAAEKPAGRSAASPEPQTEPSASQGQAQQQQAVLWGYLLPTGAAAEAQRMLQQRRLAVVLPLLHDRRGGPLVRVWDEAALREEVEAAARERWVARGVGAWGVGWHWGRRWRRRRGRGGRRGGCGPWGEAHVGRG